MFRALSFAACAVALFAAPAQAGEHVVDVPLNEMMPMRMTKPWSSIVVGNPTIADVTAYNDHLVLVTGKSPGSTNLLALDADGDVVFSRRIAVATGAANQLVLHRGAARRTYSCASAGACEAAPAPGDESEYFEAVTEGRSRLSDAARNAAEAVN